jgi:membrane protease YdiL (CAAX protease family)
VFVCIANSKLLYIAIRESKTLPEMSSSPCNPKSGEVPAEGFSGVLIAEESSSSKLQSQKSSSAFQRIYQLCLVLLIAFGNSLLSSVHFFVFADESRNAAEDWGMAFVSLYVFTNFALMAYVVWSLSRHGPFTENRTRFIRPMAVAGLCLVALTVFLPPASYQFLPPLVARLPEIIGAWFSFGIGLVAALLPLCVLGYVLHVSGSSFERIGFSWNSKAAVVALPLFLFGNLLTGALSPAFYWVGLSFCSTNWSPPDLAANNCTGWGWAQIPLMFTNGFHEEILVRAYLMTVVATFTRNVWIPVVLSVAVQSSYHLYQGIPAALYHIPLFTLYALFFLRTRSILPVALAHVLTNFYSFCGSWIGS